MKSRFSYSNDIVSTIGHRLIIIVISLLLHTVNSCGIIPLNEFGDELFDSSKWKGYSGNTGNNFRYKMLNDLYENHLSIGQSITDVDLLLGSPEDKSQNNNQIQYSYNCGIPKYSFHFDPEVLYLVFENNKLIKKSHFEG